MATTKSYSDLQQSKKLAEILPLESADMYYEEVCNLPKAIVGNYILHNQCMEDKDYKKLSNPVLSPAWSISALLDVLPIIRKDEDIANPFIAKTPDGEYYIVYATLTKEVYDSSMYDNPIDACYEMIIRLHELKML